MDQTEFDAVMQLNLGVPDDAKKFLKVLSENEKLDEQQFEAALSKLMAS